MNYRTESETQPSESKLTTVSSGEIDKQSINNLSFSDEINVKFADDMSSLTNLQGSKIKELEKSIIALGKRWSEQEKR